MQASICSAMNFPICPTVPLWEDAPEGGMSLDVFGGLFDLTISLVFQKISVEQRQMPKRSRREDRAKSMPMTVPLGERRAADIPMAFKKAVVRELIKEGKVVVKKKAN